MSYPIVLTGPLTAAVIGGGPVAERKTQGLLQAAATVTVVSPQLTPALEQWARAGRLTAIRRAYRPGDLRGARLAVAATNDPAVNAAVADEADERGCPVNVVDDPSRCTFHTPAVVRRGEVVIGVSTGGASPALARRLRGEIEAILGPEYEPLADILARLRLRLRDPESGASRAAPAWDRLIDELLPLLRAGEDRAAREAAERFAAAAGQEGER
ncbi:MAG: Siroheme synthase [Chloroflexi bacterium ADurb.Bin325]|nr:MAG: Siroheme synthase [Chloroflexi bacterium ADurb.Bin325]